MLAYIPAPWILWDIISYKLASCNQFHGERSLPRQDREKDRKREQEKDAADRVAQKEEAERRPAEKEGVHRLHPDFLGESDGKWMIYDDL